MADFPNVPLAPGVPPVLRLPGALQLVPELLFEDLVGGMFGDLGPQWGIFLGGAPVLSPDSIADFGYKEQWAICDYPLEQGAFQSYNKVAIPFDARVRITVGSSEEARRAVLEQVAAIAQTLDLYDVVTPEKTYPSCNVVHYDYQRRSNRGVGLLTIDIWLREVRVTAGVGFGLGSVASPSAASPVNGGAPQTQTPTPAQITASGGIWPA